ncbi:hypothetical protein [Mycobacterium sp. E3305]|uniref:hypothetical protein n=1 Tax=Mycobacterium sp. E3305 TaxID=1834145 RepID=UPI000B20E9D8|nr:hypothetical protein [Mycobacterium sp. E3305]
MRAAVMCSRRESSILLTFGTLDEALAVARTVPCHRSCERLHVAAWRQDGRIHTEAFGGPPVRPLAVELAKLYPRMPHNDLRTWARPASFNQPFPRRPPMSAPELCTLCTIDGLSTPAVHVSGIAYCDKHLRQAQDDAVRGAAKGFTAVGSAGEAAMEDHVLARRLRRTGDPLNEVNADGHDMSCQARIDAELSTWPDERSNPAVGVVGDPDALKLPPWSVVSRSDDTDGSATP